MCVLDGLTSDHPQGIILGPLLFSMYVKDNYPHTLKSSKFHIYADGLQIYMQVYANNACSNPKQYKAEQSKMNSISKQNVKGHL